MHDHTPSLLGITENAVTLANSLDISKDQLTSMAGLVKKAVASAMRALTESEPLIALNVIENFLSIKLLKLAPFTHTILT